MDHTAQHLVTTLKARRLTVAFAESMTCGQAAYLLSGCSGASEVLKGSVVCYSPDMKMQLFNISQSTINKHSCESMNVTRLLAGRLRNLIEAEIYGAIGLAGRQRNQGKASRYGFFLCVLPGQIPCDPEVIPGYADSDQKESLSLLI